MLCYGVVFSSMKIEHEQHLGLPYSSLRVTDLCYLTLQRCPLYVA